MIACLCTACAQAQFRFNQPIKLTEENGLPTNTTRQVKLDDNGFVWIATNEGVCRFDGQTVKTYQHDPKDSASLIGSQVNAIASCNNEIWIGTTNGISVLDPTTQKFRHYQITEKGKTNSIQRNQSNGAQIFYKDKHNDLWIGTRTYGVFRYDKKTDNFIHFEPAHDIPPIFPFLGTYNNILSIEGHISNDSIIWAGSSGGLLEINKFTARVKGYSFPQKNTDYMISMNAMRRLYHHSNGLLYAIGSFFCVAIIF